MTSRSKYEELGYTKEDDYDQFDIDRLSLLAENTLTVIMRKEAEEQILIEKNLSESIMSSLHILDHMNGILLTIELKDI